MAVANPHFPDMHSIFEELNHHGFNYQVFEIHPEVSALADRTLVIPFL